MQHTSDAFHYMYLETSGDATFTALVEGFSASDSWAKVGIMVRQSLSSYSAHYSMYKTHAVGIANQVRTCSGCQTEHTGTYSGYSSVWLRVVKQGNVLTAFYKPTELLAHDPWYQYGYQRSMNDISSNGYFIGIAVCAHSNRQQDVASANVSNIRLTRDCSSDAITKLQCDQASNCESGVVTGSCYAKGEVPSWESTEAVSSIFDVGSTVTTFGCVEANSAPGNKAVDESTNKFWCDRTELLGEPTGLVIIPSHNRASIAEGLRVYSSNNCPNCDVVSFVSLPYFVASF